MSSMNNQERTTIRIMYGGEKYFEEYIEKAELMLAIQEKFGSCAPEFITMDMITAVLQDRVKKRESANAGK